MTGTATADDGIGVFLDGRWTLADPVPDPAAPPVAPRTVWYGTAGDHPVVGDWEGDGTDGLGVVRGSTWFLRSAVARGAATVQRTVPGRQPGDQPLVWRVPVGTTSSVCPTRGTAVGHRGWVVPSAVLGRDVVPRVHTTGRLVRGSLQQSERYLLGAQYDARWRATRARAYLSLLGARTQDELHVRLPAMSALTVAVGLRTDAFDPTVVGRSRADAMRYVDQLVRSIACAHDAVSPGGWGSGWQTAHWAMLTAAAAWLVWDRLTPQTRSDVAAMVVAEADHQLPLEVPYWSTPDDVRASPGDTKAEEDAWNAGLLALAAAMMPRAPNAAAWRAKAAELGVAAYSVKSDTTSTTVVNGVPLDQRVHGYNAFDDGTVVNHGIIHPDYMAAVQLLWQSADFDRLAGASVPEAMFHDGGRVYSSLSTTAFTAGATSQAGGVILAPGGTVYVGRHLVDLLPPGRRLGHRAPGTLRQPRRPRRGLRALPRCQWLARRPGTAQARERATPAVALQRRDDGRTYSVHPAVAATQDTYPGREEYAAPTSRPPGSPSTSGGSGYRPSTAARSACRLPRSARRDRPSLTTATP